MPTFRVHFEEKSLQGAMNRSLDIPGKTPATPRTPNPRPGWLALAPGDAYTFILLRQPPAGVSTIRQRIGAGPWHRFTITRLTGNVAETVYQGVDPAPAEL